MHPNILLKDQIVTLKPTGSWQKTAYLLDKKSAYALQMALATQRPLLVRGEPGLGKSYLALAAASLLERAFIVEVINSNTEGQDLLWKDDPIQRFNDAQSQQKTGDNLHPRHYINPSILWWAFDWKTADKQYQQLHHKIYKPHCIDPQKRTSGMVLLIDEIDKADSSLPNSLLEVLGNNGFAVPFCNDIDSVGQTGAQPLVIITTNDERELPPAFVRRCLVLQLKVDEENLETWLKQRVRSHISEQECSDAILQQAAQQLKKDRVQADSQGMIKAGLSEYLDLITALVEMTKEEEDKESAQAELLENIAEFSLRKVEI
jgi:MoxR-like ATPase